MNLIIFIISIIGVSSLFYVNYKNNFKTKPWDTNYNTLLMARKYMSLMTFVTWTHAILNEANWKLKGATIMGNLK